MKSVGVIIPLYKHSNLVRDSISSALLQKGISVQILCIIDGCPFEESIDTAQAFSAIYPELFEYVYVENSGLSAARNFGLRYFKSKNVDAIYFLDSDNTIDEFALLNALTDMELMGVDWVYPDIRVLGNETFYPLENEFNPHILKFMNFSEAGSLISRPIIDSDILFDESMKKGYEDWEYWISLTEAGFRGGHSPGLRLNYRKRYESMVTDSKRNHDNIREYIEKKHPKLFKPYQLAKSENDYCPKYAFIDVISGWVSFGSRYQNSKKLSLDELKLRLAKKIIDDKFISIPEYFIFALSDTYKKLNANKLLDQILIKIQHSRITSDKNLLLFGSCKGREFYKYGISKIDIIDPLYSVDLICVKRKFLYEVIFDISSDWFISKIYSLDKSVSEIYEFTLKINNLPKVTMLKDSVKFFLDSMRIGIKTPTIKKLMTNPLPEGFNSNLTNYDLYQESSEGYYKNPFTNLLLEIGENNKAIGFVLPFANYGGVEKVIIKVAAEFKKRGWKTYLFIEQSDTVGISIVDEDVFTEIICHKTTSIGQDTSYMGTDSQKISQNEEIYWKSALSGLNAVIYSNAIYSPTIIGYLKQQGIRVGFYTHNHDLTIANRFAGFPFVAAGYEHKLDYLITCSKRNFYQMLNLGIPSSKAILLENCSTVPSYLESKECIEDRPIRLIFIGRFDRQKGLENIVAFISLLEKKKVKFELKIAGSSVLDHGNIMPHSFEKYVVGILRGLDLESALEWADCMLLPSLWEGLPLAMLEGLAKQVIPIASDVGAMGDFIKEHNVGIVIDWSNPLLVVQSILSLAENRSSVDRYRKASIKYTSSNNWEKASSPLIDRIENEI
jgi:glycosyltransferase involved in cell wall biosynthesis